MAAQWSGFHFHYSGTGLIYSGELRSCMLHDQKKKKNTSCVRKRGIFSGIIKEYCVDKGMFETRCEISEWVSLVRL